MMKIRYIERSVLLQAWFFSRVTFSHVTNTTVPWYYGILLFSGLKVSLHTLKFLPIFFFTMNSFEIPSKHLWQYSVWVHFVQLLQNAYGCMLLKEKMFLLNSSSCPTWTQNLRKVPLASSLGTATSREMHHIYSTRHIMGSQYCNPPYEKNVNTFVGMAFGILIILY